MLIAAATLSLVACSDAAFRPRQVGQQHFAPTNTDLLLTEARAQFRAGNFALATGSFRRIIARTPESVEAYNGLAAAYDRLGRFDLARRYYEEGLALAPEDPGLRTNYAAALRSHGLDREADMVAVAPAPAAQAASTALAEAAVPDATPVPVEIASAPIASAPRAIAAPTLVARAAAPIAIAAAPPPPAPRRVPRLERRSLGEVALITTRAPAQAARSPRQAAATLPIHLVRNTGRELVWLLPPVPPATRAAATRAAAASMRTAAVVPSTPSRPITPVAQRPAIVELRILNAVGRRGQAGRMERHLRTAGWRQVSAGDSTARRSQSYILARPQDAVAARRLAATLPFRPRLNLSATAGPLRLVLGRDAVGFDLRLLRSGRPS